jgi:hypothetical protein
MRFLAAAVVLSLTMLSGSARADVQHTPIANEWYGWQVLIADGSAVVSSVGLTTIDQWEGALYNFVGGHLLGGPLVHLGHRNYGAAAGSLGLRAALPLLGGALGCELAGRGDYDGVGCLPGIVYGGVLGIVVAGAIDAAALAHGDAKPKAAKSFEVLPTAGVSANGATFGLQGVF